MIGREIEHRNGYNYRDLGQLLQVITIVLLVATFISFIGVYLTEINNINKFKATKETVNQLKENNSKDYEKATIGREVIQMNQWLNKTKYWAKNPILKDFYPNEILKLKRIKY